MAKLVTLPCVGAYRFYTLLGTDAALGIDYDGTGPYPSLSLRSPDGEIELRGAAEIAAAAGALCTGARLAAAFNPTTLPQWRGRHARRPGALT